MPSGVGRVMICNRWERGLWDGIDRWEGANV